MRLGHDGQFWVRVALWSATCLGVALAAFWWRTPASTEASEPGSPTAFDPIARARAVEALPVLVRVARSASEVTLAAAGGVVVVELSPTGHAESSGLGEVGALGAATGGGGFRAPAIELASPVRVRIRHGELIAEAGDGHVEPIGGDVVLARASSGVLTVDGRPMPASIRVERSGANLDAIAAMTLAEYLPGVLEAELYAGWPIEAYRAQAVAARSYVLHERGRARQRGRAYDVDDTTRHQAYAGASQRAEALQAARDTAGVVLTYDGGRLLRAYYHSTSGGRPARAADLWPTGGEWAIHLAPPLNPEVAGEDHSAASPTHRWRVRRSAGELSDRIAAYGRAQAAPYQRVGMVAEIRASAHNPAGRPSVYEVRDRGGARFEITAEHLRLAMNTETVAHKPVRRAERVLSNDFEVSIEGDRVLIEGRGFGHGVGLCQYGAAEMARRGADHRAILGRYYPGARIEVWRGDAVGPSLPEGALAPVSPRGSTVP